MIQLTDELIRTAFAKTGFDEKYFPVYEGKVKQAYNELQEDVPDDDETTEQESNVFGSIRQANDYYAHAFANEANNYFDERGTHYTEHFVDIHAEAVEQAIEHGMDEDLAYSFGECCSDVCANGSWWMTSNYLNEYHEDWQKELFLYLANKDYKHYKKCDMPEDELNELRHEIYK